MVRHYVAPPTKLAFSLVELSIVLVILGLLVGGILSGQSLIRAAEMRSVSTQYQQYVAATHTFRDKYFALPGDMTNATAFWGQSTGCAGGSATGTCNGNGDGGVYDSGVANGTNEIFQYWRQLALAGLLEGNYTGLSGASGGNHTILGTNAPASKVSSAGWMVEYLVNYPGDAGRYQFDYGNNFQVGIPSAGGFPTSAFLKPEEAWNIDTKLDDGKPGTGKVIAKFWNNACATSTANNDYTGVYKLSDGTNQCMLFFAKAF